MEKSKNQWNSSVYFYGFSKTVADKAEIHSSPDLCTVAITDHQYFKQDLTHFI